MSVCGDLFLRFTGLMDVLKFRGDAFSGKYLPPEYCEIKSLAKLNRVTEYKDHTVATQHSKSLIISVKSEHFFRYIILLDM